jgi:hypothetical protein
MFERRVGLLILAASALALVTLACGETVPPTPVPTDTPEPTNTPRPTNTPLPTDTPRPTHTPQPTNTPRPTNTPIPAPGDVILAESFSGPDSEARWELWEDESYAFSIEGGKLIASGADPDTIDWTNGAGVYADLDLQVEATILEGGTEALFGIVFALDPSTHSHERCLVQGDDSAACTEVVDGEPEFGDWVRVASFPGGDANELRLIVVDHQWALYVNDQCVGSGESDVVEAGQIGLAVSTASENSAARIEYDNLIVRVPDDDSLDLLACQPTPFTSVSEPAPEPAPEPTPEPTPEDGGAGSGNSIVEVSNQATGVGCRIIVFTGDGDRVLDVASGDTGRMELPPGRYGWGLWLGGKTPASQVVELNLRPGSLCRIVCWNDHYNWSGCE